MGRSPGFGSAPTDSNRLPGWLVALFGLGFPAAPWLYHLTLPASATRRFILQKARHHPGIAPPALTAWRRRVSGSISLPSRGAFHLSLTVLVHYRWPEVFSLRRWSSQIPPGFLVSRGTRELPREPTGFPVRGSHPLRRAFPDPSGNQPVSDSVGSLLPPLPGPTTPPTQRQQASARWRFRLFPVRSPLLGESRLLSLPRGTKMFQFPRLPPNLTVGSLPITEAGLPHSGISGSQPARGSPERIVVRHALHRLLAPRHPPVAYSSLTIPLRNQPAVSSQRSAVSLATGRLVLQLPTKRASFGTPFTWVTIVAPRRLSTTILRPLCSFQGTPARRRSGVQVFGVQGAGCPVLLPTPYCLLPIPGTESLTTE
jgi:hypothetical protein